MFLRFIKAMTLINRPLISSTSTLLRSQFWAVIGFWNLYQLHAWCVLLFIIMTNGFSLCIEDCIDL